MPVRPHPFFVALASIIGVYVWFNVLPYHFSPQDPVTETGISQAYDRTDEVGEFLGKRVESYYIPEAPEVAKVLGNSDGANKRIEVDLTNQKVYAFEGDNRVMEFTVSTGKWNLTPTGEFTIGYKNRVQKMSGGSKALGTYYYLPNVQWVQFFGNAQIPWSKGYALHGTYWHNNFGKPMSHGCVNLRNEDAEKLFYWTNPPHPGKGAVKAGETNPGTPVLIYGKTPA